MSIIYLSVSHNEKGEAKNLGCKFDFDIKKWYMYLNSINKEQILKKWKVYKAITELIGEDRNFGENDLFVDLIPRSCWFTNVRSCIKQCEWDRLREYVYNRVNYICECCKINVKNTNNLRLEAHERWYYDDNTRTQKLMRLVALCNLCHQSTHMGLARIRRKEDESKLHLQKVRNFTENECEVHISNAFSIWNERNKYTWKLDLSLITNNNIELISDKQN